MVYLSDGVKAEAVEGVVTITFTQESPPRRVGDGFAGSSVTTLELSAAAANELERQLAEIRQR